MLHSWFPFLSFFVIAESILHDAVPRWFLHFFIARPGGLVVFAATRG